MGESVVLYNKTDRNTLAYSNQHFIDDEIEYSNTLVVPTLCKEDYSDSQ
jgi:hypothetical protein